MHNLAPDILHSDRCVKATKPSLLFSCAIPVNCSGKDSHARNGVADWQKGIFYFILMYLLPDNNWQNSLSIISCVTPGGMRKPWYGSIWFQPVGSCWVVVRLVVFEPGKSTQKINTTGQRSLWSNQETYKEDFPFRVNLSIHWRTWKLFLLERHTQGT